MSGALFVRSYRLQASSHRVLHLLWEPARKRYRSSQEPLKGKRVLDPKENEHHKKAAQKLKRALAPVGACLQAIQQSPRTKKGKQASTQEPKFSIKRIKDKGTTNWKCENQQGEIKCVLQHARPVKFPRAKAG